ncbi:MAG: hypothetical protein DRI46_09330, partial [Chloroflexi bacterium]
MNEEDTVAKFRRIQPLGASTIQAANEEGLTIEELFMMASRVALSALYNSQEFTPDMRRCFFELLN